MTGALVRFDAACRAVAECKAVDEVKGIHDKAEAMRVYARLAGDKSMEIDAAEIRIRAERRLGEMLAEQKAAGGLAPAASLKRGPVVPERNHGERPATLADAGIDKKLSSRAQKLAAVAPAEFEAEVGEWRDRVHAEGARVTTRLEQAGERAIKAAAVKSDPLPEDVDYFGPSQEEVAAAVAAAEADQRAFRIAMAADDQLAALAAEVTRLAAEIEVTKIARDGFMNRSNELIRLVKSLRRQLEKAGVA